MLLQVYTRLKTIYGLMINQNSKDNYKVCQVTQPMILFHMSWVFFKLSISNMEEAHLQVWLL